MTFYAVQIEECPGFGWQGGDGFNTLIRPLENGRNQRKIRWSEGKNTYVCPFNNIPITAARNIAKVHKGMRGSGHTFLHHDRLDDTLDNEVFGTGDGVTSVFQLKKTYDPGAGATYTRDITKPDVDGDITGPNGEAGTPLVIYADGVATGASVSATTGAVDFGSSPPDEAAVLSASGKFYVCVRFNRDDLPFSIDNKSGTVFITNGSLELIEESSE